MLILLGYSISSGSGGSVNLITCGIHSTGTKPGNPSLIVNIDIYTRWLFRMMAMVIFRTMMVILLIVPMFYAAC